ncbi:thioredoxin domain-containing protein [Tamlana sp. 2201CG12-4]|uniref:thioredoxin family protein n=1 Tax=Tamlana sp. 2201CG12-4 TaxID=3112582 RepID=UPI002DBB0737|nr:thioredoxin domain-containing protein [Tamlana sp. 2201CG12-4]MEC3908836.1 thioredoxin domain-containing protein [Tamlana sp. 2201CG12-4]
MRNTLFTVVILLVSMHMFGQGIEFQSYTFDDALAKAKKEDKLIFIDCYTQWCGPCKVLTKSIFPQKEVGDFFNKKFISLKMDMEAGEGINLAKKYTISAYPTLLFLDANGDVIRKEVGMKRADELIKNAKDAANPYNTQEALVKRYANGERDLEFLNLYVRSLLASGKKDKLDEVGKDFAEHISENELINPEVLFILFNTVALKYKSDLFYSILENKEKFLAHTSVKPKDYDQLIQQSMNYYLYDITQTGSLEELDEAILETHGVYIYDDQPMTEANMYDEWYIANKQYDKWFDRTAKFARDILAQDAIYGSRIANNILNKVTGKFAGEINEEVCNSAIKLAKEVHEVNPDNYVTYFYTTKLYVKIGDRENALANINTCIEKEFKAKKGKSKNKRISDLKEDVLAM